MLKQLICICLLCCFIFCHADVPGNKPRASYDVTITGLNKYSDYTFYYQSSYGEQQLLKDSTAFTVQGGFGAPICQNVWAVNNKTKQHTDSIYFCSGDHHNSITIMVHIVGKHLTYVKKGPVKKSKKMNQQINIVGDISSNNNQLIMYSISGFSFLLLIAMVFIIWKKNKQAKILKSI